MDLKKIIRNFPDFPVKGILFRDITPLLKDPKILDYVVTHLAEKYAKSNIDFVAGIESRGFLFGVTLASRLGKGFVLIRKEGKLPGKTVKSSYTIEYGSATMEMQEDSIQPGKKILIIDDLLATGGTAVAAVQLVENLGGVVENLVFIIELAGLNGREKLSSYDTYSMVVYD